MTEIIRNIPIKNEDILEILNKYIEISNIDGFEDTVHLQCEDHNKEASQRDKWVGDDYLKHLIQVEGDRHEGFPDHFLARNFKPSDPKEMGNSFKSRSDYKTRKIITDSIYSVNEEIQLFLGTRNNALCAFYPPGGFISWHNNWNAPGYNLIFSWSETGDGWFKYLDPKTKKIVTMQDEPGWQLKAGYFGHHGEPDKVCYHSASTDCNRITVSFIFNHNDMSLNLQDEVIAEIAGE